MANIGTADRALRFIAGFILILAGFLPFVTAALGSWSWLLVGIGGVNVATATLRYCPAYSLLGISTCRN